MSWSERLNRKGERKVSNARLDERLHWVSTTIFTCWCHNPEVLMSAILSLQISSLFNFDKQATRYALVGNFAQFIWITYLNRDHFKFECEIKLYRLDKKYNFPLFVLQFSSWLFSSEFKCTSELSDYVFWCLNFIPPSRII